MKWLVRLYPGKWRQRYGDAFEELLKQRPLMIGEVFDVVKCAIRERVSGIFGQRDSEARLRVGTKEARTMLLRGTLFGLGTVAAALALLVIASSAGLWQPIGGASRGGTNRDIQSTFQVYAMERSHGV